MRALERLCLISAHLSSDTQLCEHGQTLVPNTAIFPPCHQMVALKIEAELLFVFSSERL